MITDDPLRFSRGNRPWSRKAASWAAWARCTLPSSSAEDGADLGRYLAGSLGDVSPVV